MLASFDSHLFWSALTSGPYWRGALTALELTVVALGTAVVLGFFVALGALSESDRFLHSRQLMLTAIRSSTYADELCFLIVRIGRRGGHAQARAQGAAYSTGLRAPAAAYGANGCAGAALAFGSATTARY